MARPALSRATLLLGCAAALVGCSATIPDGQIVCRVSAPDCPDGFICCPSEPGEFDGVCSRRACSASATPEEVATGRLHTCLRLSDGSVVCFGSNADGQLGQGSESPQPQTLPVAVRGLAPDPLEIEASAAATCARFSDRVQCWGDNQVPPLAGPGPIGSEVERSPVPRDVELNESSPHRLAMGAYYACAIVGESRTLECWGHNGAGQLGVGSTASVAVPVAVPDLVDLVDVCAGDEHTCALSSDGSLFCWGGGSRGQLGVGVVLTRRETPQPVPLADVVEVECGYFHTCAVTDDGATRQTLCWGENRSGETGQDPGMNPVRGPEPLGDEIGARVERLAIGGSSQILFGVLTQGFTLAAGSALELHAFGDNTEGKLGLGGAGVSATSTPLPSVEVAPEVIDLDAGADHACAIDEPRPGVRRALCWGDGTGGRLGNASERGQDRPTPVVGYAGD